MQHPCGHDGVISRAGAGRGFEGGRLLKYSNGYTAGAQALVGTSCDAVAADRPAASGVAVGAFVPFVATSMDVVVSAGASARRVFKIRARSLSDAIVRAI